MTTILGVDPGRNGALAVLETYGLTVEIIDMPDTTPALHEYVANLPVITLAVLEKPFYPRMIGVNNVAKIALNYGILTSAIQWCDIPMQEVRPKAWKQALNLGSSKSASREKASQLFPASADQFKRVKDDGRAEAALIAWYGMRWIK